MLTTADLEVLDAITVRIKRLDRAVLTAAKAEPRAAQLQTVPGIGPFGALLILAEIGSITRFRTSHELAAFSGLVPTTRSSGDKTTHGSVGRSGSPWLKWILIEVVQTLKLAPGPIGMHYEHLLRAKGQAESDRRRRPEVVLLFVLDADERLDIRRVVAATRGSSSRAGGAPASTHGFSRIGSRRHPITRSGHLLRTNVSVRNTRRGA